MHCQLHPRRRPQTAAAQTASVGRGPSAGVPIKIPARPTGGIAPSSPTRARYARRSVQGQQMRSWHFQAAMNCLSADRIVLPGGAL